MRESRWISQTYSLTHETIDLIAKVNRDTGLPKSNLLVKAIWETYGEEYTDKTKDYWKELIAHKNTPLKETEDGKFI